jgi:hypothetical protein
VRFLAFLHTCFNNHLLFRQAKKDLSSHCDQIVMSLATLNKQRLVEKQSIRTTVTISKVSKTPVLTSNTSPIMTPTSQSRRFTLDTSSEKSDLSTESPQMVHENSLSLDTIPFADADVTKKKELAKEIFFSRENERGE